MKRISVFCGSSPRADAAFLDAARDIGVLLAEQKIGVVYGGASIGLMGALADGALSMHGEVVGVIPDFLHDKEIAHAGLTQLKVVQSMHERKQIMHDLAEGFIILPGGFGTLDELFETLTWAQLRLHDKPVGLLNTCNYFESLLAFIEVSVRQNFVSNAHENILLVAENAQGLFRKMLTHVPSGTPKFLGL